MILVHCLEGKNNFDKEAHGYRWRVNYMIHCEASKNLLTLDMVFVVQMCELSRWKADIIIDDLTMPPIRGDVLLF